MEQLIGIAIGLANVGLTSVLVACMVMQVKIMRKQKDIMGKQAGISDKQTELMAEQNKLSQKMDRSGKVAAAQWKYVELSDSRHRFWRDLGLLYHKFQGHKRRSPHSQGHADFDPLYSLIDKDGLPDFEPPKVKDLRLFVQNSRESWCSEYLIWDFAEFVHRAPQNERDRTRDSERESVRSIDDDLRKAQADLAYFWHFSRVSADFELFEYLPVNPRELVMLTWLEFALALEIEGAEGPGKTGLFLLAKEVWDKKE